MTFRLGPLRAALWLAAGFVAVRVAYRVLFHGAEGTGPVLLPFPVLRLPRPFSHVVLLGPATADGLGQAVLGALPIAANILAFGVLAALLDLPRLFARGARRGPLRGVSRTLAVAWATLPALAEAVRAVRLGQRLRGERAGIRLLAPVLERTLGRATAVAAALEVRGLAGHPREGDCARPVELRGVRLGHRGGGPVVPVDPVPPIDLTAGPGRLVLVTGATGSGKTTLLRALVGLHTHVDGGTLDGTIRVAGLDRVAVPPRDTARLVGYLPQNPREGFAADRVRDEIGLSLELRGAAPAIVAARVTEIAGRLGIEVLLDRRTSELSAGEATLVSLAAAIAEQPVLLLADEPLADLDADARRRIVDLLDALAHGAGLCVIVAEHRAEEFAGRVDERYDLGGADAIVLDGPPRAGSGGPVLRARVGSRGGDGAPETEIALVPGEIVALVGPNGAGKSTLLRALAREERPGRGAAAALDLDVVCSGAPVTARRLVPDVSDDLFLRDTVAVECARADRRAGAPAGTTLRRWADFLGVDARSPGTQELRDRHPLDLSQGQRRCLALAVQLAAGPRVLLVDEPTRGLDPAALALVARALREIAARGTAVLVATHDADFAEAVAVAAVPMRAGRVGERQPVRRVLAGAGVPAPPGTGMIPVDVAVASGAGPVAPPAGSILEGTRREHRGREHADRGHLLARAVARGGGVLPAAVLIAANAVALAAFTWPFVAFALPEHAQAAVPAAAFAMIPVAALVVLAALDGSVRTAHTLALLGTLAAVGTAVRIGSTGVGGVEALFLLLILAGRAYGPRFGLLLGLSTILLSAAVTGGVGPWLPFQMFACAWVGAGAGLLPRRVRGVPEIAMLAVYGVLASYLFGLMMNLWFWPFAVGGGIGISYQPGAPPAQNLGSFFVYSLVTSTLGWDTLRAVTTVVGLAVIGRPVLAALRRATPVLGP